MIGFLRGKVYKVGEISLLLDVGGVGYEVFMSGIDLMALKKDEDLFVYTYYHQKEDIVALFGFRQESTKRLFELLTSVSGLGPKTALGIFSNIGEADLISAIRSGDASSLVKIPGIGNKTAGRIILELQDKLINLYGEETESSSSDGNPIVPGLTGDAESALQFLGYGRKEIN